MPPKFYILENSNHLSFSPMKTLTEESER